jgi:excisionase family DNA binding protein
MSFDTGAATNQFLNAREIAARLRVSHGTVFNLIGRGELACHRFGKRIVVSEAQLEQFISRTQQPSSAA